MTLAAHLRELRSRSLNVLAGIVLGAAAGWIAYPHAFALLQAPIRDAAERRAGLVTLNFAGVASSLDMQVRVSVFLAILLSAPWWMYQIWAFITPGLTGRERRYTIAYLAAGVPLFAAGAYLAWWLLPEVIITLTSFTPVGAANLIDAQSYLSFVMRLIVALGLAFLLPVAMVALNAVGVAGARFWLSGWRVAVLSAFVFAAVASPTGDAVTMCGLALPVLLLYAAACGICLLRERRGGPRARPSRASARATGD